MMENDTDEPLECVRQYSVDTGQNKTVYFYGGFSGIPENLVLNIIVYLVSKILSEPIRHINR